ncbi:hypothetical protein C8R47DRAFT_1320145, partial [Mycena vitilis]
LGSYSHFALIPISSSENSSLSVAIRWTHKPSFSIRVKPALLYSNYVLILYFPLPVSISRFFCSTPTTYRALWFSIFSLYLAVIHTRAANIHYLSHRQALWVPA